MLVKVGRLLIWQIRQSQHRVGNFLKSVNQWSTWNVYLLLDGKTGLIWQVYKW
jgi:hypothetical protein